MKSTFSFSVGKIKFSNREVKQREAGVLEASWEHIC